MKLKRIKIGAQTFEIKRFIGNWDNIKNEGLVSYSTGVIDLYDGPQSLPEKKAVDLVHEIMHVILDSASIRNLEEQRKYEEWFVDTLSIGLIGVIRHNPGFLKEIMYRLNGNKSGLNSSSRASKKSRARSRKK